MKISGPNKIAIVNQYLSGISVTTLSTQNHIPKSTIYYWIKLYKPHINKNTSELTTVRANYELQRDLRKVQRKLAILEECTCTPNSSIEDKVKEISRLKDKYGIHLLCDTLKLRRSTYYHRVLRSPQQTLVQKDDEKFKPIISQIFEQSKRRFGPKKIRVKMQDLGYRISVKRIHRLMKEMSIVCPKPQKFFRFPKENTRSFLVNRVKRNFSPPAPNMVWVSDITYLWHNGKFIYLCAIMDLFSRKIIAHRLSDTNDMTLIKETFLSAFESRGEPYDIIFHSDQGAQYVAYDFRMLLKSKEVRQSFSKPACPYDNSVIEKFFSTFKQEEYAQDSQLPLNELLNSIDTYINEYYNDYRPHEKLGGLTPTQAEERYAKSI